ncbi:MAG: serine/threonine protein kinase [Myxococcales bacterium]|nr:serine/threonine protein kinase [Myxococcales bacterium]
MAQSALAFQGTAPSRIGVGDVVAGRWRIDRELADGPISTTYSATHRNGRNVSLKVLHRRLSGDRASCERLLREAYLANSVDHPSMVRVLDDGATDAGEVYLVLEHLDGVNLETARLARGGTLPLGDVVRLGALLFDALHHVHQADIVHRDLRPSSLFSTASGELKLLDFGSACFADRQGRLTDAHSIGSPAFMAPEQALSGTAAAGDLADQWSAAATLFTLLTGRTVHDFGASKNHRILAATRSAPSMMTFAEIPPGLAAVLDRCLAFLPDDRFVSTAEARDAWIAAGAAYLDASLEVTMPSADDTAGFTPPPDLLELAGRAPPPRPTDDLVSIADSPWEAITAVGVRSVPPAPPQTPSFSFRPVDVDPLPARRVQRPALWVALGVIFVVVAFAIVAGASW